MRYVELTGFENYRDTSVGEFLENLPQLLGSMTVDERRLVCIAEFDDCRYVQFWVEPEGLLSAEVISNLNIGEAIALSDDDEAALVAIGFEPPISEQFHPNYRRESLGASELIVTVEMVRRAVLEVLREKPENHMIVKIWDMPDFLAPEEVEENRHINQSATDDEMY